MKKFDKSSSFRLLVFSNHQYFFKILNSNFFTINNAFVPKEAKKN